MNVVHRGLMSKTNQNLSVISHIPADNRAHTMESDNLFKYCQADYVERT